jgi:hypothetical protein
MAVFPGATNLKAAVNKTWGCFSTKGEVTKGIIPTRVDKRKNMTRDQRKDDSDNEKYGDDDGDAHCYFTLSCVRCTHCAPCAVSYTLYTHARALTSLRARLLVNALLCVYDTGETKSTKPELPQSESTVNATQDTSARVRVREKRGLGL